MARNRRDLERALSPITSELLNEKGYLCFVDIFMRLGYLSKSDYENWRLKRVPYLERVLTLNLPTINFVMKTVGGCLASHSNLRGSITPTPPQQGVHEGEANPNPAHWSWARLLKRVFAIDMATCPQCQQSPLRLIAAITDPPLIRRILSYLKLSPHPQPIEPARWVQAPFPWTSP